MEKEQYFVPETLVFEVKSEDVICASNPTFSLSDYEEEDA